MGHLKRMSPTAARRLSVVVWLLSLLAWVAYLAFEAFVGFANCELVAGTSLYGESVWTWLPPGTACVYDAGVLGREVGPHIDAPPLDRLGIALVLFVLWPVTLRWSSRRARASNERG